MIPESPGPPRRNQFLLGPQFLKSESWLHIHLGSSLKLSAQADLDVQQVEGRCCRLTLLGFMLDWIRPIASNFNILRSLAAVSSSFEKCVEETFELGGRWILVYQDEQEVGIFHDAGGLRQVCYTTGAAGEAVWCASQPDLLAEAAALTVDSDAIDFIDAMEQRDPEYWWPGDRLPFKNAKVLLPNHSLSLNNGRCRRFWPFADYQLRPMDEVCRRACDKLTGIIRSAANRYDLAVGLSAGWDSRLMLAASRGIKDQLTIYTAQTPQRGDQHRDIAVPRKLTRRLGLNHVIIVHPEHASAEFSRLFNAHTWQPHLGFAAGVQAEFDQFRYSKMAVIGNVSEIAKLPYRNRQIQKNARHEQVLASLVGMDGLDFASEAIGDWLSDVDGSSGYQTLDLFYWEQRIGRWLAANLVEFDFGWKDIFIPFNVRSLICDLLACKERYRQPSEPALYVQMMKSLWPAVLSEPINSKDAPTIWQRLLRRIRRLA